MTETNELNTPETEETLHGAEPETQPAEQTPPASESRREKKSRLEARVAELEQSAAEQTEQYKRVLAEYDNFRKRTAKERESVYTDAVLRTVGEFLPVLDNLERAASAADAPEGVQLIIKQFCDILEKQNVHAFGEAGEPFDPLRHNAMLHAEGTGGETVIAQVFLKGYAQGDRIIRHADVQTTD